MASDAPDKTEEIEELEEVGEFAELEIDDSDIVEIDPETERRTTARVPARLGVRFQTAQEFAKALRANTVNIGLGGLCIATRHDYPVGAELRVVIEVPGEANLEVPAVVAWGRAGKAVGVRFLALDASTSARLARLVGKARDDAKARSG